MSKPKISIIIAVYNTEKYLQKCLDSILSQTFKEIEIICINDCSTDNSLQILKEYSTKDKRIKVLQHQENLGQAAARNLGIQHAKGDYIMFCDSDDYYDATMCNRLYHAIHDHNVDIAMCGIKVIYHTEQHMRLTDQEYYRVKFYGHHYINDNIIEKIDMAPTNKIFHRTQLERIGLEFPHGLKFEDAYFVVCYLAASRSIYFIDDKLYFYIRHANSTMSDVWSEESEQDYASDHLEIAIKIHEFLTEHRLVERYNKVYWKLFLEYLLFAANLSKTPAKGRAVRARAKAFTIEYSDELDRADKVTRRSIKQVSRNFRHFTSRVWSFCLRTSLKFRPLFKLQSWSIPALEKINDNTNNIEAKLREINQMKG